MTPPERISSRTTSRPWSATQGRPLSVRHQPDRRRAHAAGDATSACSSTRTCGRPRPTGRQQRRLPALLSRRRLSRRRRDAEDDQDQEDRPSTISGLPTVASRSRRHPLRIRPDRHHLHGSRRSAARTRPSPRRSTCSTSASPRQPGRCARSSRPGRSSASARTASTSTAAATRTRSSPAADAIYVANGNNDSISVLDPRTLRGTQSHRLSLLRGADRTLKGVQPVRTRAEPRSATSCTWPRPASTRSA